MTVYERLDPFGEYELVNCATSKTIDFDLKNILADFIGGYMVEQAKEYNWGIVNDIEFNATYAFDNRDTSG